MSIDAGPHNLDQVRLILGPDGSGTLKADSPNLVALNQDRNRKKVCENLGLELTRRYAEAAR